MLKMVCNFGLGYKSLGFEILHINLLAKMKDVLKQKCSIMGIKQAIPSCVMVGPTLTVGHY